MLQRARASVAVPVTVRVTVRVVATRTVVVLLLRRLDDGGVGGEHRASSGLDFTIREADSNQSLRLRAEPFTFWGWGFELKAL